MVMVVFFIVVGLVWLMRVELSVIWAVVLLVFFIIVVLKGWPSLAVMNCRCHVVTGTFTKGRFCCPLFVRFLTLSERLNLSSVMARVVSPRLTRNRFSLRLLTHASPTC